PRAIRGARRSCGARRVSEGLDSTLADASGSATRRAPQGKPPTTRTGLHPPRSASLVPHDASRYIAAPDVERRRDKPGGRKMPKAEASLPWDKTLPPLPDAPLPALPWIAWLTVALVTFGVACRLFRFWLNFPIWIDEASLALNFVERDYRGLLRELNY